MAVNALYWGYARTFQGAVKLGNCFLGYRTPELIQGPGCLGTLGAILKEKNINDILLVTGEGMLRRGTAQPLLDSMEAQGIRFAVAAYSKPDPTDADVEWGYELYRQKNCRAIVALGGGSRIDCAKAIAARVARPKKTVTQMQGLLRVKGKLPPFVAIPTTAGAGSESTIAAIITESATHRKAAVMDPCLMPRYAVLDPTLTVSLPPATTASTGMDALTHAVEAYLNRTYNTSLENDLAKKAVGLIYENLLRVYENGADLEARQNMQLAAFYAGRAFTRGCVGYVHALGHTLGGLYGVGHGDAMAALLPRVLRQYGAAAHRRLAELADVCGMAGNTEEEKAEAFLAWIEKTNGKLGVAPSFPVIRDADIPRMIAWAMKEANPLYPVPVIWDEADFENMIQKIRC